MITAMSSLVKYVLVLVISVFTPLADGEQTTTIIETSSENISNIGEFLYQVSLHYSYNDEFICGGSIISSKIVLTAAHCMYYKWGGLLPPLIVTVCAGNTNLNESTRRKFSVANIILHPSFNKPTMENDLAVVEVNDEFPINDLIGSVSLEKSVEPQVQYNNCIVSVWNQISYDLEVAEVVISACENFPDNICTTKRDENDTICINGAGNPLICDGKLIGVLSVEPDCNDPSQLTIFENVRHSMTWLDEFDLSSSNKGKLEKAIFSYVLLLLTVLLIQL